VLSSEMENTYKMFDNHFGISKLNFCPVVISVINHFRRKKFYASVIVEILFEWAKV